MSDLEFVDGSPLCERCMTHWRRDTPLFQVSTHYFRRYHEMNGH
jgi:hypothetical protein